MTNLPGHDGKLMSDMNLVLGASRDYCSYFWLNFQAASKFVIVSVRLILPKVRTDGFTGPRRESDVRDKFNFKLVLKVLECR